MSSGHDDSEPKRARLEVAPSLSQLPLDVVRFHVAPLLAPADLCSLTETAKSFAQLNGDTAFWREYFASYCYQFNYEDALSPGALTAKRDFCRYAPIGIGAAFLAVVFSYKKGERNATAIDRGTSELRRMRWGAIVFEELEEEEDEDGEEDEEGEGEDEEEEEEEEKEDPWSHMSAQWRAKVNEMQLKYPLNTLLAIVEGSDSFLTLTLSLLHERPTAHFRDGVLFPPFTNEQAMYDVPLQKRMTTESLSEAEFHLAFQEKFREESGWSGFEVECRNIVAYTNLFEQKSFITAKEVSAAFRLGMPHAELKVHPLARGLRPSGTMGQYGRRVILDGLCGDLYFDLDDVDKTLRGVRFQALSSDKADNGEALPAIIAAVRRMEEELKEIHGAPVGTEGSLTTVAEELDKERDELREGILELGDRVYKYWQSKVYYKAAFAQDCELLLYTSPNRFTSTLEFAAAIKFLPNPPPRRSRFTSLNPGMSFSFLTS